MPNATWKAVEAAVAALFGTKRIPVAFHSQRADGGDGAPDAETDKLAIQVKHSYRFPAYLREWMRGITKNAHPGKVGIVVWHPKGARFTDSLVILRASDFAALVQALPASGSPPDSPPGSLDGS